MDHSINTSRALGLLTNTPPVAITGLICEIFTFLNPHCAGGSKHLIDAPGVAAGRLSGKEPQCLIKLDIFGALGQIVWFRCDPLGTFYNLAWFPAEVIADYFCPTASTSGRALANA